MTKPLMIDHCNTFTSRNCLRFPFLRNRFLSNYLGGKLKRTNTQKIQRNYQNVFHILNLLDWRFRSITHLPNFQKSLHISFKYLEYEISYSLTTIETKYYFQSIWKTNIAACGQHGQLAVYGSGRFKASPSVVNCWLVEMHL